MKKIAILVHKIFIPTHCRFLHIFLLCKITLSHPKTNDTLVDSHFSNFQKVLNNFSFSTFGTYIQKCKND